MATERKAGRLPNTKANQDEIIGRIENDRPVGAGHHQSHQTEALKRWLEQKRKQKS